jgi:hypothetical protein
MVLFRGVDLRIGEEQDRLVAPLPEFLEHTFGHHCATGPPRAGVGEQNSHGFIQTAYVSLNPGALVEKCCIPFAANR